MITFNSIKAVMDWWETNAKGKRVGVLLWGLPREVQTLGTGYVSEHFAINSAWVVGFPE